MRNLTERLWLATVVTVGLLLMVAWIAGIVVLAVSGYGFLSVALILALVFTTAFLCSN